MGLEMERTLGERDEKKNPRKACITDQLYRTVGKYSKQTQVTNCGVWRQEMKGGRYPLRQPTSFVVSAKITGKR